MPVSYQRILVPLDGSDRAAAALPHAEAIAKLARARLILLQVIPSAEILVGETAVTSPGMGLPAVDPYISPTQFEEVEDTLTQEAGAVLQSAAAPLIANGIQVEAVILKGTPADGILAYAKDQQADLVIMSTHGRTGLARIVYGSVAERVLHRASCPVMLVRVAGE